MHIHIWKCSKHILTLSIKIICKNGLKDVENFLKSKCLTWTLKKKKITWTFRLIIWVMKAYNSDFLFKVHEVWLFFYLVKVKHFDLRVLSMSFKISSYIIFTWRPAARETICHLRRLDISWELHISSFVFFQWKWVATSWFEHWQI